LNVTRLNISQAARAAGVSRGTLYNHIKKGRLSVEKGDDGRTYVQVAELQRVFDTLNVEQVSIEQSHSVNVPALDAGQQALVDALRRENELLRNQLEQANIEKLALLDVLKSQTRLLQAPRDALAEGNKPRQRRWWRR